VSARAPDSTHQPGQLQGQGVHARWGAALTLLQLIDKSQAFLAHNPFQLPTSNVQLPTFQNLFLPSSHVIPVKSP